jgi:polar amino acid transport system substrate-binding protein
LEGAKIGKYDGLYSVWYRPEREEWFVFSDALPANELGFFKHKDKDISFGSYDELKPYTIGVVRGYALPPGFEEAGLKTSLGNDDEQNMRKLYKRHVALVLIDKIQAQYIINSTIPEAADKLDWIDPPAHVDIQYLVISKQAPDHQILLADFNSGLAEMTADGTLVAIMTRHGFSD